MSECPMKQTFSYTQMWQGRDHSRVVDFRTNKVEVKSHRKAGTRLFCLFNSYELWRHLNRRWRTWKRSEVCTVFKVYTVFVALVAITGTAQSAMKCTIIIFFAPLHSQLGISMLLFTCILPLREMWTRLWSTLKRVPCRVKVFPWWLSSHPHW